MYDKYGTLVVDEMSCVKFDIDKNNILLIDLMENKQYEINQLAKEICLSFDGEKSINDIAIKLSKQYATNIEELKDDVVKMYQFLKDNKLILVKKTFKYNMLKFAYKILCIK